MARIIFVTGGCRSGKSRFALEQANKNEEEKYFIATCPRIDPEMDERIELHRQERKDWNTIEEELDLVNVIGSIPKDSIVLLDCLSLWVNNLMYHSSKNLTQEDIKRISIELGNRISDSKIRIVYIVTNEVGMGLVPETKEGRLYRDFLGICNQIFSSFSEEAYFLISGIPIQIKPSPSGIQ
ncbi:bifunctional adenosylcobinamide kinase/adenosylcobinamide-phosphate guanylyltransferase [Leptospira sarikeiensis]|uniref:Adenosylcobinamide kinase n=1 Tax=Leptospira sarikeiensis TaxID=2484943 RepID=A0A4R9K146_9LEPT|nr:bifunctional adenosylcobinamide kinase/adenosylcobinamide-phosphate guanylyltransferase [Leptospira sarikeiensis]TGL58428.1 bifunctional adenosylcobinamide kinase/adenosylcobinamide-phosphate guanylyltransferase [Leptospira sarikeiensis]